MIKSWMVIGGVALIVALAANLIPRSDIQWFNRLQRPRWLVFEKAIPLIWTVIFICAAWSAVIVWKKRGNSGDLAENGFVPAFRNSNYVLHLGYVQS